MADSVTVRIIRTYHVDVKPEYGDDDAALVEKGQKALKQNAKPEGETAVLLKDGER